MWQQVLAQEFLRNFLDWTSDDVDVIFLGDLFLPRLVGRCALLLSWSIHFEEAILLFRRGFLLPAPRRFLLLFFLVFFVFLLFLFRFLIWLAGPQSSPLIIEGLFPQGALKPHPIAAVQARGLGTDVDEVVGVGDKLFISTEGCVRTPMALVECKEVRPMAINISSPKVFVLDVLVVDLVVQVLALEDLEVSLAGCFVVRLQIGLDLPGLEDRPLAASRVAGEVGRGLHREGEGTLLFAPHFVQLDRGSFFIDFLDVEAIDVPIWTAATNLLNVLALCEGDSVALLFAESTEEPDGVVGLRHGLGRSPADGVALLRRGGFSDRGLAMSFLPFGSVLEIMQILQSLM
mmetsp:Transcript_96212/g.200980  ORF Transcript_96212/g.200980 Transcript_96212/m.200980 type:complete len:346 (+) Transcript_96212:1105-2142(+)